MKASDVMTTQVVAVHATTSVDEIARLLMRHAIGGVPVVDARRRVIGIVTERDLFLKKKGIPFSAVKIPTMFKQWVDPRQLDEIYELARQHTAADVMTADVVCADPDDNIRQVAWLMVEGNLKHIPVARDGQLLGIITRTDMIRPMTREE
jgi:CBS domain-containing protein